MGLGIVSMHYLGMSALHASAHMTHAPTFVAASVAVAIAASGLALFLAGGRSGRPPLILSAIGARLRDLRHALHGDGRPHRHAARARQ